MASLPTVGGSNNAWGTALNQFLTVSLNSDGTLNTSAWNPMNHSGDMIYGGTSGIPTRLAAAANGTVLTLSNGLPTWLANTASLGSPLGGPASNQQVLWQQADGSILVLPLSTYSLSGDDGVWINNAFGLLPTATDPLTSISYTLGTVRLAASNYNIATGIIKPPKCNLIGQGPGTVLSVQGAITGVFSHHGPTPGGVQNLTSSGGVYDLLIDGTGATGSAIGIDMGDGNGHRMWGVKAQNFCSSGATGAMVGVMISTRHFWTEKFNSKHIQSWNNDICVQIIDTTGNSPSMEYSDHEFYIRAYGKNTGPTATHPDQCGVQINSCGVNGSMRIRGNMISPFTSASPNPVPATLSFINAGAFNGELDIHTEVNGSAPQPYKIYFGDTNCAIGNSATSLNTSGAFGLLRFDGGVDPATPAIGQFAFKGPINNCDPLRQPQIPGFPGSGGTGLLNKQCDSIVFITGGSVSSVKVDGVTQNSTTGPFFVPWNRSIIVNYTGSPTWTWQAAT